MNCFKPSKVLFLLIFIIPFVVSFGQEEEESQDGAGGDAGGDTGGTAAETAVTGSASQPTTAASGSTEGNPLVVAVRSGAVSITDALTLGVENIRKVAAKGGDFKQQVTFVDAAIKKGFDFTEASALIDAGVEEVEALETLTVGSDLDTTILSALSDENLQSLVLASAIDVSTLSSYSSNYQTSLVEAAKIADSLLVDRIITSSDSIPTTIGISDLTSNGYNVALLELLNSYGAIGSNGSTLLNEVMGSSRSLDGTLSSLTSTSDYLTFLSDFTGSRAFHALDATSTVLSVPMSNVNLAPGANITLGTVASASSIDVSEPLGKAIGTADRKIAIIGAAKDMTVAGDVTFTNPNNAEDHALVLGAADDFMLDGKNITYTGSNLALGAGGTEADSMYLVNTTITTGGNLAAGTLGTLNISKADFVVGNANSATSDPDNVYLYANDLIQVNGLNFSGSRLDDVYMEAITINLNDVDFPSTAEVMLRSRDGSLHFGTYGSPVVGGVNLTDVTHGAINGGQALQASDFDGTTGGHIDSLQALGNGVSAIRVRAQ